MALNLATQTPEMSTDIDPSKTVYKILACFGDWYETEGLRGRPCR